jgi:hypothetical protein
VVFSPRELVSGVKHISVGWTRALSRRPDSYFIPDYTARGVLVERYLNRDGRDAICSICGYAMIRLELPNGWLFETCSAMPTVTAIGSPEFMQWAQSLAPAKLPTARV